MTRNTTGQQVAADFEVLRLVLEVARELQPTRRLPEDLGLDSQLEADFGLDSLGRTETVLRLKRTFCVDLPDRVLGEAETPRDLLKAILAGGPQNRPETAAEAQPPAARTLPPVREPRSAQTLVEAIRHHVGTQPEREQLRILNPEGEDEALSYRDLDRAAAEVAQGLLEAGVKPGDRVGLILATGGDFFRAFLGVLYAGAVPVPLYPPVRRSQIEDHMRRQAGSLGNAGAVVLIVEPALREIGQLMLGLVPGLNAVTTLSALRNGGALEAPMPSQATSLALIQYTSGSTGDPKGVALSNTNLLANIRAMSAALDVGSDDVFVSWLPLYHDMGLIGAWLGPLYLGARSVVMSPLAFLSDPGRWLRAISKHRATLSAAPNFAYDLCVKSVRDEDIAGVDLGSLRLVANGAEPVSPGTIRRFSERFAGHGFQPGMMAPVYGLAENAVGLTFPPLGREPIVDRIRRDAMSSEGRALPADADDATALEFVACGRPLPGHEVRIVDRDGLELPERHEGRLQFKGSSATAGYFRNPEKNSTLFDGDWVESFDRAYIAAGDIFITGRIKDMIIKAGRNLYPQELEALVGDIDGVRKGCVAAFASTDPAEGPERLVLMVETRLTDAEEREALSRRIRERCAEVLDVVPDTVDLVPPQTVPKTSSGKIRRSSARALHEGGMTDLPSRGFGRQITGLALAGMRGHLRRLRRRIGVLGFAAWWWTALLLVAPLTWISVLALPRPDWSRIAACRGAQVFLWLTGARPNLIRDDDPPPADAIHTVNHASYIDSLVVLAAFGSDVSIVAKKELEGQRIAGPFLRRLGTIFVERSATTQAAEDGGKLVEAAREGKRIFVYPEGTLLRIPGLLGFRLGPFQAAVASGRPVVPVTLLGTRDILRGGQWLPRRGPVTVHVGAPIAPDGDDFAAAVRLRDRVRAVILAQCGEPDLAHERFTFVEGKPVSTDLR